MQANYLEKLATKHVLIKLGGELVANATNLAALAADVQVLAEAKLRVTIVHGGGPQIATRLKAKNLDQPKVDGIRPTSKEAVTEVADVLCNEVNSQVVNALIAAGAKAEGLCGSSDDILVAQKMQSAKTDFGYVGEITEVNTAKLNQVTADGVAVLAPVATSTQSQLNVNADSAANAVAVALGCAVLVMVTDTAGVLDQDGNTIASLDQASIELLKHDGIIKDGMIPKVDSALSALADGVGECKIINGNKSGSILIALSGSNEHGTTISLTQPEDV